MNLRPDANMIPSNAMYAGHVHVEVEDTFSIIQNGVPTIHIVSFHIADLWAATRKGNLAPKMAKKWGDIQTKE